MNPTDSLPSMQPIGQIAASIGIDPVQLVPYGHHIAKVPLSLIDPEKVRQHHLVLVTAITPTKAGIGKTTTSIGLALGLAAIGKKAAVALREPSLGVCFGMKGGATGGGKAAIMPMEAINLHFTGDFHAITSAHNMITALLDNYQFQHRASDKQLKEVVWKRVLDINDRTLRNIVTGLGGLANGTLAESGFDITPASEIMAILCLAEDLSDLRHRIDSILLGFRADGMPFTVADLGVGGAITVLLKDALQPNLVQTCEHTAAFIHGGPFANIAHGCNSVVATKMALSHADFVITEAGFGADLGAEKFFNIKCRAAGLWPKVSVLVVSSQALKLHGGVTEETLLMPNLPALEKGLANAERHVQNLQGFGQQVVVAYNHYNFDSEEEVDLVRQWCARRGLAFAVNNSYADGSAGATDLAEAVVRAVGMAGTPAPRFTYQSEDSVRTKIEKIAKTIYRANGVRFDSKAEKTLRQIGKMGLGHFPVCIAKTQYSFSDNPSKSGAPENFDIYIEELILNRGAGFVVARAGSIMRMPGLPKIPQANFIDLLPDGEITGLR